MKSDEIQIRDPFIVPVQKENCYYLFGTTDKNAWSDPGNGFDCYTSPDLQNWDGPFPAFRPPLDFWGTKDFWAPEVHEYHGRFYMFATFKAEGVCRGTQVLVADQLKGPYAPHSVGSVTPGDWECLDGTLYIQDGKPWLVFCHEWLQVTNGEICAVRLKDDLTAAQGEPVTLFRASDAEWAFEYNGGTITDGPFLWKSQGSLIMLWSSMVKHGYGLGIARSETGRLEGPWHQEPHPLYQEDGGHGMIFRTFEGELMLTVHAPNTTPDERPIFLPLEEHNGTLGIEKSQ